jgi:hypothetical protein
VWTARAWPPTADAGSRAYLSIGLHLKKRAREGRGDETGLWWSLKESGCNTEWKYQRKTIFD